MSKEILEILLDTGIDALKLLPFLFVTYLIMEYIEHKTGDKTKNIIKKSGKWGPVLGAILGIFPQCGFSAAAANLYAGKVITMGTLIAIFLSTSDEMLPILISEAAPVELILKVLAVKLAIGLIAGIVIDCVGQVFRKKREKKEEKETGEEIGHMCEHEHCHCEKEGIFKSSIKHTLNIFNNEYYYTLYRRGEHFKLNIEYASCWTINSGNCRFNSKLCIICYINTIIFTKCNFNRLNDRRATCWFRNRYASII